MDAAAIPGQPGRFTGHQLGSFRLGPLLGRGGMGEIYDAMRIGSGEPAAVKLLARHALIEPTKIARFLRELEIARTLRAPNVAAVLEVGDLAADLPYLAMERLKGHDLDRHLRQHGRLTPEETATLVQHVADGLTAAHAAGIVHRDLKPSNVFRCDPEGAAGGAPVWKILDFGVSKLGSESQITLDAVVGTPAYMSPEQAKGEAVDVRTDVYGLGAIAYAALPHALDGVLARVDGVMLTGSKSNVDPSLYGGEATEENGPYDRDRDATTIPLIRLAIARGVPLLAICRGMQELNVALGGTLDSEIQDMEGRIDHRAPVS
ncbi:MAG: protein kinase, partial [Kofleriaceae bacterium]